MYMLIFKPHLIGNNSARKEPIVLYHTDDVYVWEHVL